MNMHNVYSLHCNNCDNILSLRGQSVFLVSKQEIKLYSTDLPTLEIVEDSESKKFEHCECKIKNISCKRCKLIVGYHVVQPCAPCSKNNNGHYWLFMKVQGKKMQQIWDELPTLSRVSLKPIIPAQEFPDKLKCEICQQLMESATKFKCKHSFCYACAMRQVDVFRCCPIDQLPVNPNDITKNQELQSEIDEILIYCENGCCLEEKQYKINTEENACKQLIKLGQRDAHEMMCVFNTKHEE